MKIGVVGTGYVGLVAGVCFADSGHYVVCVDKDSRKISLLEKGETPIYEPGLSDLIEPAIKSKRLEFTTDLGYAAKSCEVIFIAVGTPELPDGNADMGPTRDVVLALANAFNSSKCVVLKSTVPVGTSQWVKNLFIEHCRHKIHVVNNPEFLKEGAAVDDFLKPDRIVIGCDSEEAKDLMETIYSPFVKNGHPIIFMDNASAELTKYAANAFLSVKISFANELALLSDKVGADYNLVRKGFTSDRRINPAFFYPGIGYGGSCFPKDTQALIRTGEKNGVPMEITKAAEHVNDTQKFYLLSLIDKHFKKDVSGKTFAMWGLSFKPRTDDVREAPAFSIIKGLAERGAKVKAFDPVGGPNALKYSTTPFTLCESAEDTLKDSDGLIVATEWNEFRNPDFEKIKKLLKTPVVFDGRNVFEPDLMRELGFSYYCIGRQVVFERPTKWL